MAEAYPHYGCGRHDRRMEEEQKLRLDLQKDVASELFVAVRDSLNSLQRTLQIGVALVAALFAAAFARGVYAVFLFAPIAVGLLLCYQSQVYSDLMVLAWQREQVLRQIRSSLGEDVLSLDVGITRHGRSNPSILISQYSYFLLLYGLSAVGFYILAVGNYPLWGAVVYGVSVLLGIAASHFAALEQQASWDRCEQLNELFKTQPNLSYEQLTDAMVESIGWPGRVWTLGRRRRQRIEQRIRQHR